ncbi:MAG: HupE/UreJ family protein [Pseudolabrys sp.]|nr:HupE/UreJ family protein [Pseudolabrys sp.]MSP32062.1 HupE/UreJ family protein [Pseudolabrys sp.]
MLSKLFARIALPLLAALAATAATAHEIRPAIVTATFTADGRYEIAIVANMEALLVGISPIHSDTNESPSAMQYNQFRALSAADLQARISAFAPRWLEGIRVEFNGARVRPELVSIDVPPAGELALARISTVHFKGVIPAGAGTFKWRYAAEYGSNVLRVKRAGDEEFGTSWLKDGAASETIPLTGAAVKNTAELFFEYLTLGFTHIVPYGLDHILFVLGLYLLSSHIRPLLIQVTAFTVAHSITLGLGLYGIISVSPAIVEPLIAASIAYVAIENLITAKLHVWRPFVVFGFGLLHGLGFAGVLHEIGLPRADYVTGLVAFNIGVEFGQLTVISVAFAVTGLWFRARPWYRARIVQPASIMIAIVGLYWTVERVITG